MEGHSGYTLAALGERVSGRARVDPQGDTPKWVFSLTSWSAEARCQATALHHYAGLPSMPCLVRAGAWGRRIKPGGAPWLVESGGQWLVEPGGGVAGRVARGSGWSDLHGGGIGLPGAIGEADVRSQVGTSVPETY